MNNDQLLSLFRRVLFAKHFCLQEGAVTGEERGGRRQQAREGRRVGRHWGQEWVEAPPTYLLPGAGPGIAGSTTPGPWSCAAWHRVAGMWWDTSPGHAPWESGPSQPRAPPLHHHPLPWAPGLTSSWSLGHAPLGGPAGGSAQRT